MPIQLPLIRGVPHKHSGVVYLKNSILQSKTDRCPLSGNGCIQRYSFGKNGSVTYDSAEIRIPNAPFFTKGLGEHSLAPLANFSNTAVYSYNSQIYSAFESKPMVKLDPVNLNAIEECTFDNKHCNFMSAHSKFDSIHNGMWTFSSLGNSLKVMRMDGDTMNTWCSVHLPENMYVHDFLLTPSHIVFPLFPIDLDLMSLILGRKSVIEAFRFKTNEHLRLLSIDRSDPNNQTITDVPQISNPVFHIAGSLNNLYLFATEDGFQFEHLKSACNYTSTCFQIEYDTHNAYIIDRLPTGDMPSYFDGTLAYVNSDSLHVKRLSSSCTTRPFPNCILEEPQFVDSLSILQIVHTGERTQLHIIDPYTMFSLSIYELHKTVPQGTHGTIIYER